MNLPSIQNFSSRNPNLSLSTNEKFIFWAKDALPNENKPPNINHLIFLKHIKFWTIIQSKRWFII